MTETAAEPLIHAFFALADRKPPLSAHEHATLEATLKASAYHRDNDTLTQILGHLRPCGRDQGSPTSIGLTGQPNEVLDTGAGNVNDDDDDDGGGGGEWQLAARTLMLEKIGDIEAQRRRYTRRHREYKKIWTRLEPGMSSATLGNGGTSHRRKMAAHVRELLQYRSHLDVVIGTLEHFVRTCTCAIRTIRTHMLLGCRQVPELAVYRLDENAKTLDTLSLVIKGLEPSFIAAATYIMAQKAAPRRSTTTASGSGSTEPTRTSELRGTAEPSGSSTAEPSGSSTAEPSGSAHRGSADASSVHEERESTFRRAVAEYKSACNTSLSSTPPPRLSSFLGADPSLPPCDGLARIIELAGDGYDAAQAWIVNRLQTEDGDAHPTSPPSSSSSSSLLSPLPPPLPPPRTCSDSSVGSSPLSPSSAPGVCGRNTDDVARPPLPS